MAMILLALSAIVELMLAALVVLLGYLLFLTGAAVVTRPGQSPPALQRRRFAVLVPAHNEEAVIGRLLTSLGRLEYPIECVDVCVVADNCTDATASISRRMGARAYERFDDSERAKGFALRWLLQQLESEGRTYDAYVIVDADSVLAPNFLQQMNARLEHGAEAVQAYYAVLNAEHSAMAGLRYAALAAVHYLRPLGRSRFGLSAGLKGNGMCLSESVVKRFAWRWFTLAEDVEFHLALVEQGIPVEFAPETWVKADMPVTLRQATSQNERWERGRLQLVREHVPRLLWRGMKNRSWLQIDAAAEQLIPPLSLPFAAGVLAIPLALLVESNALAFLAAACLAGYALYVLLALALVRAPIRVYLMLCFAPVYIAWKVGLYARSLFSTHRTAWIRTARAPGRATPS